MVRRALDLVVFGATGFTGQLVAAYLQQAGLGKQGLRWGLAGRSEERLAALRNRIGAPGTVTLITADATDAASLRAMVRRTRLVITTAGPYQLHGEALLQACVDEGIDYVDLCGEPAWMARMIQRHDENARKSGARVVFSCGFDSVPFDLGVCYLQRAAMHRYGSTLQQVHGHVLQMKGGYSGGTAASLLATLDDMRRDPASACAMADPFALTPGFRGPPQPDSAEARFEPEALAWSAPFVMAPINSKNLHRTNALLGHPWGTDFVYEERQLMGSGMDGELRARGAARSARLQSAALAFAPARALIRRFAVPKPGQGPSPQERDTGRYLLRFSGRTPSGFGMAARVEHDRDPGYGSSSRIVAECALSLVADVPHSVTPGGVWTPGAALGLTLLPRLQQGAGMRFSLED
jgi:short subunit dehydrogenase-like uncharacterized protein